jgi:hypothetical protein
VDKVALGGFSPSTSVSPANISFHHCSIFIYHCPHEVCDCSDQAAHYHNLGPQLGASLLTRHIGWKQKQKRKKKKSMALSVSSHYFIWKMCYKMMVLTIVFVTTNSSSAVHAVLFVKLFYSWQSINVSLTHPLCCSCIREESPHILFHCYSPSLILFLSHCHTRTHHLNRWTFL